MVTALSCDVYCRGALNLIDSFDSGSEPPWAFELVTTDTSEKPPTELETLKAEAPFASSLFVTMYSKITMLPSDNFLPNISSPKYISNLPVSVSCKKYAFDVLSKLFKPAANV